MKRNSLALPALAMLPFALLLAACPPEGGPPAGPPPGSTTSCQLGTGATTTFVCLVSTTLAPTLIASAIPALPGAACGVGSQRLNTLTASGTATITLGAGGDENSGRLRVDVAAPGGTYAGTVSAVDPTDPTCVRTVGPAIPLTGTWTTTHRALVDKQRTPNCVFASNAVFTSTVATPAGGPSLASPASVDAVSRTSVQFELDRVIADKVDEIRRSSAHQPLAAGASGRCPNDFRLMTEP